MHWILFLLFAFFLHLFSSAQSGAGFKRLGVNEGLSQNSVYSIFQDRQGFMWFGTGDGLNRYDGKQFTEFRGKWNDTSGKTMPARIVLTEMVEDSADCLWFYTNGGLVVFNKRENRFSKPARNHPTLEEATSGGRILGNGAGNSIWILQPKKGFGRLHTGKGTVRFFSNGASPVREDLHQAVLFREEIYYLSQDWLFGFHTGNHSTRKLFPFPKGTIRVLNNGKIALTNADSAVLFHPEWGTRETLSFQNREPGSFKTVLAEYPAGVFYVSVMGKGMLQIDRNKGRIEVLRNEPFVPSSLSNDYITTAYVDRSNNLWVGTEGGGLSRLDLKPQKFGSFPGQQYRMEEAANLMVKSLYFQNGKILAGTFSQGLYVIHPAGQICERRTFKEWAGQVAPQSINLFHKDGTGRIWMNVGNVIGFLDTAAYRFRKWVMAPAPPELRFNFSFFCMEEYRPGRFLLGSNGGLHRLDVTGEKLRIRTQKEDAPFNGHIQTIRKAPDGSIFIGGMQTGFTRVRVEENGALTILDRGLKEHSIRHVLFPKGKPIAWFATENGLAAYHLETKKTRFFDEDAGMSNSFVYALLQQNDSVLWASTNKGLNRALIRYARDGSVQQVQFTYFTQVDGLQSNEFNTGAYFRTEDGTLLFGGVNGINWFHPDGIITNHHQPPIALTGLFVNNQPYLAEVPSGFVKSLKLDWTQNTLSFRFAALEFTNSAANQYAYMLEGYDQDWTFSQKGNEARYSQLPPGSYVFRVKGSNSDGVWSPKVMELSLEITPPYWQTWWFRLAFSLLVLAGVLAWVRWYIRQKVRARVLDLEKQKAINDERLRISRDMHDELGTGLTKIALLSEVTRQKLQQAPVSQPLQEIAATSRQLTAKMGEIIWTLNPANDTLDNLAAYLKEQVSEMSETMGLDVMTSFPHDLPPVRLGNLQRQQVLMVTKEAFNNILKHSGATEVRFTLELLPGEILFQIQDNGTGFEPARATAPVNGKKNGLENMAWRMAQAGGSFGVQSRKGEGTTLTFSLSLPS